MTACKKTMRCADCGGSNVLLDAYAFWNDDTQDWEVAHSFDNAHCDDCDGETSIVECWLDTGEQATTDLPLIDVDERGHELLDHAIAVQREIAAKGVEAFAASHDDATGHEDEIVYRSAPRWAWDIMDETLDADTRSHAFDPSLRESVRSAINAMILSCERGDDAPISREEAGEDDEAEG